LHIAKASTHTHVYLFNTKFTFTHLADAFIQSDLQLLKYVRGRMPLEQLRVKCLAQGHIDVSQWNRTRVSHQSMCGIHCGITTPIYTLKVANKHFWSGI